MERNNILAVVVTFNRLNLLKRCYEGLKAQTYKDFDILIVNNGSTDGTREWIDSLPENVLRIHQANLGGAGGFYAGQKYGYDNGYEWIWMMDDDGLPDKDQLKELINCAEDVKAEIVGPVVANIDKPEEEAFYPGSKFDFQKYKGLSGSCETRYVCPFNGLLIHRHVIDKIGLIKRELFIWGDEREYTIRWRRAGIKDYAAFRAIHFHPQIKAAKDRVLPWSDKYKVVLKPRKFTSYYYRNNAYINKHYFSNKILIAEFFGYAFYFLRKFDFSELSKFIKSYISGIYLK